MKLNSSALFNLLLCGSLLLLLSPACGKNDRPSSSQTPEPAATAQSSVPATATPPAPELVTTNPPTPAPSPKSETPSPTPTPSRPTIEGAYKLNDPGAAERIKKAIDGAVKDVNLLKRWLVRGGLEDKNLPPPPQLIISYTVASVTIESASGRIQTSADGKPVERMVKGDKVKVSTQWIGSKLQRTFKSDEGQRVNTYSLSGDEKYLTMQVNITSSHFKPTCSYELKYARSH